MKHQWLNLFRPLFFFSLFLSAIRILFWRQGVNGRRVAQLALLKILRQPIPKAVLITAVLVLVLAR